MHEEDAARGQGSLRSGEDGQRGVSKGTALPTPAIPSILGDRPDAAAVQQAILLRLAAMESEMALLRGLILGSDPCGAEHGHGPHGEAPSSSSSSSSSALVRGRTTVKRPSGDGASMADVDGDFMEDDAEEQPTAACAQGQRSAPRTRKRSRLQLHDEDDDENGEDADVQDGIAALPPEIWTHILRFVALCPAHARRAASSSSPSTMLVTANNRSAHDAIEMSQQQQQESNASEDDSQLVLTDQSDHGEYGREDEQPHEQPSAMEDESDPTRNIFSGALGTAMLVCRTWRKIALSHVFYHRVHPLKHKQHIRKSLPFLSANCKNLKVLNLSDCRVVDSMLCHLPQGLTHLHLCGTQITDAGIEYLPLSLTHLYLNETSITNAGVDDIPPHVEELSLDYTYISVNSESTLFSQFSALRSLSLSASENVTDKGVNSLPSRLERLCLSSSGTLDDYHQFGDDAFFQFSSRYPKLVSLRLDDVDISGEGMRELHQCTTIKQLQLSYCSYITDEELPYLPPYLLTLELNHLSHVEGDGLSHLPDSLECLYLQNMQHLPVETIAGNIPKKLKALVIEAAPSGWTEALRKLVPSAHSVRVAL